MIVYQPNYLGLTDIRNRVGALTGGDGTGSPDYLNHLNILGKNFGFPVALQVGPNTNNVVQFLRTKMPLEIHGVSSDDWEALAEDIPFNYWISFDVETRSDYPLLCAKIIIMAYLTLNTVIHWQPLQPHV